MHPSLKGIKKLFNEFIFLLSKDPEVEVCDLAPPKLRKGDAQ